MLVVYARVAPNLQPLRAERRYSEVLLRGCGLPRAGRR
jgi:hypothetical protein